MNDSEKLMEYEHYLKRILSHDSLKEGTECLACKNNKICCTYLKHAELVWQGAYAYPGCIRNRSNIHIKCIISGCPFRYVCTKYDKILGENQYTKE